MEGYRFKTRLRVRYSEVDAQRIVFNSNYLTYLDIAVGEYFREGLQLDLAELEKDEIFDYVIKKVTLNYHKSATMYDWLNIWCRTVKMGNTSMVMEFAITRDGEDDALLTAEILYVSYNPKKKATQPIPDFLRQTIENYEHSGN
ncbi:Acyl-CoA thioester hydrolase YbgC [Pelotomaculum schinkii]|uniref:Acyl-CoA thioester hydrolase YbgC n=1 Tax=Pelotomaculum schinkii TaxID=78350 RepID=A0A4Y7RB45_9FIRM|nr:MULTISPECIES: thioesterase family protein [Pelotomaculum]TEB06194.1 Acyl-CoA thioester hydrolase YbgC [Pelotomaculum schinkii]TEB10915.1 Acyl-CoA thioester hydrolase YbgC [Pelotomaculum sp. FP]